MKKELLTDKEKNEKVPTKDCPGDTCRGKLVLVKEKKLYSDYECEVCLNKYRMDNKGIGIKIK